MCSKVVDELQDKPDLIVLDPPRDGIHPKALGKYLDFGVDRMVYISCKPTSLVRIWWCCRREGIGWRKFVGWICFRGRECRGGNNDAELWFGRKIEGLTTRYSGFWRKSRKNRAKMAVFDLDFWPFIDVRRVKEDMG